VGLEPVDQLGNLDKFATQYMEKPLDTAVALGICMDLNPYQGTAPWSNFEFANHVLSSGGGGRMVIISMAWFSDLPDESHEDGDTYEPDSKTVAYWIERF
jgi:protein N-terminal amidase